MTEPAVLQPAPFLVDSLLSSTMSNRVDADFRRGINVRLARGWYTRRDTWNQLAPWERIPLVAGALTMASPNVCFSGATAAQLMGLPGAPRPDLIHIDRRQKSHLGLLPKTFAVAERFAAAHSPRRFARLRGEPWDGTVFSAGHFHVVPPEIAAVEVAIYEPFTLALQVLDMLLRTHTPFRVTRQRLLDVIDAWPVRSQARLARRTVMLADARSGSAMESLCRAIFLLYGFEPPDIQAEFSDSQGSMYVDFYWASIRLVIEYDGQGKWMDPRLDTGRAQWDRIHRHNERHDRLLAQPGVDKVVHLVSEDLRDINTFVLRMTSLGIPRDPRRAIHHPRGLAA